MDALAVVKRLGGKNLIPELADALKATAREVVETGKDGTVTVTLTIKAQSQGDPFVTVSEKVSRKSPTRDAKGAWFYAVGDDLHDADPRQEPIDFRVVDHETGEVRERAERATTREAAVE